VGGENTKMNARNQRNLKEILKGVGSKSLLIIESNRDTKNESWEIAIAINKLCEEAFKMLDTYPNRDDIAQHKDWGEYADNRKEDLN
jgi:DNA-binding XRE family transcriptional regulator